MRARVAALFFLLVGSATAQSQVMRFEAYPPHPIYETLMGEHAWQIFASGEIDASAGERLKSLITAKNIPLASRLYLNSPGGNLIGGIELGRTIRKHLLQTQVGQRDNGSPRSPAEFAISALPGECYSACALAFLGGEFRYWIQGSVYGVHQFFSKQANSDEAGTAQIVSAMVVEYIRSMGVDTKLFQLKSQAGPSEIITPSHDELLALNVVNDGAKPAHWTIESVAQGIYLKGTQETAVGLNKFIVACPPSGPMALLAIFDAGMNADDVMKFPVEWLFLDEGKVGVEKYRYAREKRGSFINLTYKLDASLLKLIANAKTSVGVGLQPTAEAAFFAGFARMPFQDGATKLPGILHVCQRPISR